MEQEQDKSLTNNRLIQTLKRQHDELMTIYQQNQKQMPRSKIDREQQTIQLHLHDSQIQTDVTTISNSKISPQQKSTLLPTNNSHQNGPLTATRTHSTSSNSNSTSTLQPLIPSLATTTMTTKTSTVTTKTAIVTNSQTTLPPIPPPTPSVNSHDIVDLTEEDEDETTSRVLSTQRTAPLRQVRSIYFTFN